MNKSIILLLFASCAIAQSAIGITVTDRKIASSTQVPMPSIQTNSGFAADFANFAQKSLQVTLAGTAIGLTAVGVYQLYKALQNWWQEKHPDEPFDTTPGRILKASLALAAAAGCVGLTTYNFADVWNPVKHVSELKQTITVA